MERQSAVEQMDATSDFGMVALRELGDETDHVAWGEEAFDPNEPNMCDWDRRFHGEEDAALAHMRVPHPRPVARVQLATRDTRIEDPCIRAWYTVSVWQLQKEHHVPMLPACTWCGVPTGNFCEDCNGPLCTTCEDEEDNCRVCSEESGGVQEFGF